jgi:hypothetical protein
VEEALLGPGFLRRASPAPALPETPNNRGDRAVECEAIETFLMDSLNKP